ncbi:hypothetical protein MSAN_01487300 [Mycena sanguinolenta]|uniref:Uncharacterized protein n=1 Tax=Mycena sanguinolenta TaxID=230812 RepID=A0A8H6Y7G5_9AGAR|nr:hypothetical protein MSAN_01487300 [Mycena sanguinolenta]
MDVALELAKEFRERVNKIVDSARALHAEILAARASNGPYAPGSVGAIAEDLQRTFQKVLDSEELRVMFPAPEKALGHEQRQEVVSVVLDQAGAALKAVCAEHGIDEERVAGPWEAVRGAIGTLVVLLGDLAEQHPRLTGALLGVGSLKLIPVFLRPLLQLFGFGPAGPERLHHGRKACSTAPLCLFLLLSDDPPPSRSYFPCYAGLLAALCGPLAFTGASLRDSDPFDRRTGRTELFCTFLSGKPPRKYTRAIGVDASSNLNGLSEDNPSGSSQKAVKGKGNLPKRKENLAAKATSTFLDKVLGDLQEEQSSKAAPLAAKTSRSKGLKGKKKKLSTSVNDSLRVKISDQVVPSAAHPPSYPPPSPVKTYRSKALRNKISNLTPDNDSLRVEIPDEEIVLTPSPPYLVFGKKTAKFRTSSLASTSTVTDLQSLEPASLSPVEASHGLKTGVALFGLPPFTTLAEVARIALRTRVTPGDVSVVRLWLSATSTVFEAEDVEHGAQDDENGGDVDRRPDWTLGARIQFRENDMAHEFWTLPLLLEVCPPPSEALRVLEPPDGLRVRVFPSAEFSNHWKPEELVSLAAQAPPWHDAMFSVAEQGQPFNSAPSSAARADQEPDSEHTDTQDQEIRERAQILQSLWGRLETPLQSDGADASVEASPTAPEVPVENALSSADPEKADSIPEVVQMAVHEPEENPSPDEELMLRAKAQLSPNSVLISVHMKLKKAPASLFPLPLSSLPTEANSPPPLTQEEEDEQKDPIVERYATAFRNALARERELEAELRRARVAAQEHTLAVARTEAEAQVRADFGRFGALEGVWVRGTRVRAPAPSGASGSGAGSQDESTAKREREKWVYEMHALVAFADTQDAVRARTVIAVQPRYAGAGLRFVSQPWAEAIGGLRWEEQTHLDVGGGVKPREADGAREGWARRLEREHQAEARAREREEERERQRGAAEGTWGKERLDEIRERLRRAQRRMEWEREREEAWARVRTRGVAQTVDADAVAAYATCTL